MLSTCDESGITIGPSESNAMLTTHTHFELHTQNTSSLRLNHFANGLKIIKHGHAMHFGEDVASILAPIL